MKEFNHKVYFLLILTIGILYLSSCDPITETHFLIENTLDEDVIVYFVEKDSLTYVPDSLFIPMKSEQKYITYTSMKSKRAYADIEKFLLKYDSIFAEKQDGKYSRNFMNNNDWEFHILSKGVFGAEAQYKLRIQESDF